jgi:hypothetical protein
MKKKSMETMYLALVDGGEIDITFPSGCDYFEEVYSELINSIIGQKMWWIENWGEWRAVYKGINLSYINCRLVVGIR